MLFAGRKDITGMRWLTKPGDYTNYFVGHLRSISVRICSAYRIASAMAIATCDKVSQLAELKAGTQALTHHAVAQGKSKRSVM